jgi:hypothetical protein
VNSPAIKRARFYTSLILFSLVSTAQAEWEVDFSRRRAPASEARPPAISAPKEPLRTKINERVTETMKPIAPVASSLGTPEQEIVILNTEKGFVPRTVRVRQGGRYLIHVTNINAKEKNVSFMLDSFSENHATYFGEVKSFMINPQRDGVFSFQCPETSAQGEIVVFPSGDAKLRLPAEATPIEPTVQIIPIAPEH